MKVIGEALTFDDVSLIPSYSDVLPKDVSLTTRLTTELNLNVPLISAAMDTVTEARLAIAMAQEGGLGVIHKNMSLESQAEQVRIVKKYEAGVIKDPITVSPDTTISEVLAITHRHNISGVPVVDGNELVGIVTSRDMRFERRLEDPVRNIMTGKKDLITVKENASQDEVLQLLHRYRIEKVLVVNDHFELRGLITVKDIQKSSDFPNAAKDSRERLLVAAAVGVGGDTEDRIAALVEAHVDVIIVDTAHGHTRGVLDRIRWIKKHFPNVQVIGGNVTTGEGALALVEAGADGVKIGQGPGSICTTRIVAGVGVPQITAINNVAMALAGSGVPCIGDGGIRFSGDVAKAIAAGAWTVMIGGLFAGLAESPGQTILYQGRSFKIYRGMGSLGAMVQGSSERYRQDSAQGGDGIRRGDKLVPEGVEGRVPFRGPLSAFVYQLVGGLRAGMGYCGARSIEQLRTRTRFIQVSAASVRESHPHDIAVTQEAPNYSAEHALAESG